MKNLVLAFGVLFALSFFSCTNQAENATPNENDSTMAVQDADTAMLVSGVAVDGALNGVYLLVGDDTIEFTYPDLDSDHRASWEMGDSISVRYYVTENGDSVTDVINESNA